MSLEHRDRLRRDVHRHHPCHRAAGQPFQGERPAPAHEIDDDGAALGSYLAVGVELVHHRRRDRRIEGTGVPLGAPRPGGKRARRRPDQGFPSPAGRPAHSHHEVALVVDPDTGPVGQLRGDPPHLRGVGTSSLEPQAGEPDPGALPRDGLEHAIEIRERLGGEQPGRPGCVGDDDERCRDGRAQPGERPERLGRPGQNESQLVVGRARTQVRALAVVVLGLDVATTW